MSSRRPTSANALKKARETVLVVTQEEAERLARTHGSKPMMAFTPRQVEAITRTEQIIGVGGGKFSGKTFLGINWLISGNKHPPTCGYRRGEPCDCEYPDYRADGSPIMENRSYIYNPKFLGCVLRKNLVDLRDWIREARAIYEPTGGEFKEGEKTFVWPSGAQVFCAHYDEEDAFTKFAGLNIVRFLVEEATHIPNVKKRIQMLASCNRAVIGSQMVAQMMLTFNPGGVSHGDILDMFVKPHDANGEIIPPGTPITETYDAHEIYARLGVDKPAGVGDTITSTRVFIFSTIKDNPNALANTQYIANLMQLPEEEREAYLFGNWDILSGEYFKCHDAETEVLTSNGFKLISSVRVGDFIASMSPGRDLDFVSCSATHAYDFDGEMLAVDTKSMNWVVTPNHNMYCEKDNNNNRLKGIYKFVEARNLPLKSMHVVAPNPQRGVPIEEFVLSGFNRRISSLVDCVCPVCGAEYQTKSHRLRHGKKTTCSRKCSYKIRWNGGLPPIDNESGTRVNPIRISFDPADFCELLGWYLSEGCLMYGGPKKNGYITGFVVCQQLKSNPDKVERIAHLLFRMGLRFRYDDTEFRVFNRLMGQYFEKFGRSHDKFIPRDVLELPPDCLRRALGALVDGDGHRGADGKIESYFSASKQLADDVQELALRLGIASTIGPRGSVGWTVCFWDRSTNSVFKRNVKSVRYVGKVYCLTVPPHHVMLTRRRGRLIWSGNSFRPQGPHRGEPPEACHVVPQNLAISHIQPWWWATAAMDWGYSHECAFGIAFHNQEADQLWVTDEMVVSETEPDIVGEEVARRLKPILRRYQEFGQEPMITMGLSHDAYGLRQDDRSVAELISKGMARVLGPELVHVPDLLVDKLRDQMGDDGQSINTREADEMFERIKSQKRMGITIKRMRDSRIVGWQLVRSLMRWKNTLPAITDLFDPNLANQIAYERGMEAYNKYLGVFQQKREVLPKLQIVGPPGVCPKCGDHHVVTTSEHTVRCCGCGHECHIGTLRPVHGTGLGCSRLINALPKAIRDELNPEDVTKKHVSGASDLWDMLRYLCMTFRGQSMPEPFEALRRRRIAEVKLRNPQVDTNDLVHLNRKLENDWKSRNAGSKPINVVRGGRSARAMTRGYLSSPQR